MQRIIKSALGRLTILTMISGVAVSTSCNDTRGEAPNENSERENMSETENTKLATFGGGCFWCVEAVFQRLDGVVSVRSGYTGGMVKDPTYEQICTGKTGHAEVCQVRFDPEKIGFDELLEVFFNTHDPTTKDRQGNDVGTQYRSVVFYHDDEQKQQAEQYIKKLTDSGAFKNPIVTEVSPLGEFYAAEKYHQNYFNLNPNQGYCRFVIQPKVEKLKKNFKEKLKQDE